MKEKDILKGNKLIAEFMGCYLVNDAPDDFPEGYYMNDSDDYPFRLDEYQFHNSWDWLMPVVEKIDSLDFKTLIGIEFCEITRLNESTKKIELIAFEAKESKMDSVFQAIVEFVKWHKKQVADFLPAKQ